MKENIKQWYAVKLCVKLNISITKTFDSLIQAYGDALYLELWFLSGTKLSKRAEKILNMNLVLEGQSHQQIINMWKWCEL
jgi:hypothetical protein